MSAVRRRGFLGVAAAASAARAAGAQQAARPFPERTVRIVVPYAPGGGSDIVARLVAQRAAEASGQAFAVENRGGGASIPGTQAVAMAAPDGHTVGVVDIALVINPGLFPGRLPYDAERDLAAVGVLVRAPQVLAQHAALPPRGLREMLEEARARPGAVGLAHAGNGTANHLAAEQLQSAAGVRFALVGYRGAGPAATALVTGEVPYGLNAIPSAKGHIDGGRLRPVAVTSRSAALPDTPTFAELGLPEVDTEPFFAVVAPAGVPGEIVARLNALLVAPVQEQALAARLEGLGYSLVAGTPGEFAALIRRDSARWRGVIERAGIRAD